MPDYAEGGIVPMSGALIKWSEPEPPQCGLFLTPAYMAAVEAARRPRDENRT